MQGLRPFWGRAAVYSEELARWLDLELGPSLLRSNKSYRNAIAAIVLRGRMLRRPGWSVTGVG
jgi:hypothetical protein